jgi:hypothetical protein
MIAALFRGGLGDCVLHLDPSWSYLKLYKISGLGLFSRRKCLKQWLVWSSQQEIQYKTQKHINGNGDTLDNEKKLKTWKQVTQCNFYIGSHYSAGCQIHFCRKWKKIGRVLGLVIICNKYTLTELVGKTNLVGNQVLSHLSCCKINPCNICTIKLNKDKSK